MLSAAARDRNLNYGPGALRRGLGRVTGNRRSAEVDDLMTRGWLLNTVGRTFTRASTAWCPFERRLLASGEARRRPVLVGSTAIMMDLIEGAATNLLLRSQDFSTTWTSGGSSHTVTTDAAIAPDGTATADMIVEAAANAQHFPSQPRTFTGAKHTESVYVKRASGTRNVMVFMIQGTFAGVRFNLASGTVDSLYPGSIADTTGSIVNVGGGWYRCSVTATMAAGAGTASIYLLNGTADTYLGDGTSGLYLWQSDLVSSAFPTTPIPTAGATANRAGDALTLSLSGLPGGGLATDQGTMWSIIIPQWTDDQDGTTTWALYRDADVSVDVYAGKSTSTQIEMRRVSNAGATNNQLVFPHGFRTNVLSSVAETWDATYHRGFVNGLKRAEYTPVGAPPYSPVTSLELGHSNNTLAGREIRAWLAVMYWNFALSEGQLRALADMTQLPESIAA